MSGLETLAQELASYNEALKSFQWLQENKLLVEGGNPCKLAFDYAFGFSPNKLIAQELILREQRSQLLEKLESMTLPKIKDWVAANYKTTPMAAKFVLSQQDKRRVIDAILSLCDEAKDYEFGHKTRYKSA